MISEEYKAINRRLHEAKTHYGGAGFQWAAWVYDFKDILDYGCGKGTLQMNLGREIAEYDPAIPGKDADPEPHDYVVCTDVLEHIEPMYLTEVLEHINSKMKVGGFFVISTRKANKTLEDGRNAHLIVKPWEWWEQKLRRHFTIDRMLPDAIKEGDFAVWVQKLRSSSDTTTESQSLTTS